MSNTAEAKKCAESKNPTSPSQSQSQSQAQKPQQNTAPNPHACKSPYPTLKRGDKNKSGSRNDECVSAVQYNLQKGAHDLGVTGAIDDKTVNAIQNFQKFFQLPVTGTLTPQQVESIATIWGPYATSEEEEAKTQVSGEGKLDLVFMGDGVSDDTVASAASRFGAALYSFAPYSQYKDRIAIHTITEKPSCSNTSVDSNAGPYTSVSCQTAQAATASGVPTDKVVVVSSSVSREHANRGSSMSISPSTSTSTFLHEMGHVMGLADEYHGYEDGSWGEQSLTAYGQCITATGSTDTKMFFNGDWKSASGPWSAWAGLGGVDWHRECSDTRWLRPSADSIMRSGFGAYNSVSEFIVKNELERHMTGVESTLPGYGNTGSGGGVFSR